MPRLLGPASEIPPDNSKQYRLEIQGEPLELFVVAHKGQFYAYENRCPHVGVALNWQADVFLNLENTHIQCATHGAQFRIDNGLCEWGPCLGQSLRQLPLQLHNGELFLADDA